MNTKLSIILHKVLNRKMKKEILSKLLITLAISMTTLSSNAQNASQARKILDKSAAIVGRKDGASANFKLSDEKHNSTSGYVAIKGDKFYATTSQATVWYDGKTQWCYIKRTNEVNISVPNDVQQISMNPYKFITMYKNGYTLGMTKNGSNYVVHLISQNKKNSVQEMYITINAGYHPQQVKIRQGNTWTTINISNFSAKSQSDAIFKFPAKEYANAEIIDLR